MATLSNDYVCTCFALKLKNSIKMRIKITLIHIICWCVLHSVCMRLCVCACVCTVYNAQNTMRVHRVYVYVVQYHYCPFTVRAHTHMQWLKSLLESKRCWQRVFIMLLIFCCLLNVLSIRCTNYDEWLTHTHTDRERVPVFQMLAQAICGSYAKHEIKTKEHC